MPRPRRSDDSINGSSGGPTSSASFRTRRVSLPINGGSRAKCERLLQHRYMQIEGIGRTYTAADRSNCSGFEGSNPSSVRVHPIADALDAVEPQRAARVAIEAGIVAQVAVLGGGRADLCPPLWVGCGWF